MANPVIGNSSGNMADGNAVVSVTHNVNANSNRLIVALCYAAGSGSEPDYDSCTIGGESMTIVPDSRNEFGSYEALAIYYILEADIVGSGNQTLELTTSGGGGPWATAVAGLCLSNVDQDTPLGALAEDTNTHTLNVASAADDIVVSVFGKEDDDAVSAGGGQTEIMNETIDEYTRAVASYETAVGNPTTASYSDTGNPEGISGIAIKGGAAAEEDTSLFFALF